MIASTIPLPRPRCANCVFRHDDGLCYRRGVNSGFYDWQQFTPSPCYADNACFYHRYKPIPPERKLPYE